MFNSLVLKTVLVSLADFPHPHMTADNLLCSIKIYVIIAIGVFYSSLAFGCSKRCGKDVYFLHTGNFVCVQTYYSYCVHATLVTGIKLNDPSLLYRVRATQKAREDSGDRIHFLSSDFQLLPLGRRYPLPRRGTNWFKTFLNSMTWFCVSGCICCMGCFLLCFWLQSKLPFRDKNIIVLKLEIACMHM